MTSFWQWVGTLSQGQASFLGSVTGAGLGSGLGLLAIILGAMYNARKNRQRDDRLREHDRQAVAIALHAELSITYKALLEGALELEGTKKPASDEVFFVPYPRFTTSVVPHV